MAQCISSVEKDAERGPAERSKQVRAYVDRALELLRQAVAKGFRNAAHMKQDKDLDRLRSHPEFQKLLTELEAKTQPEVK